MRPCCFETCLCRSRHRRHGITFHEFPKCEEIRAKWVAIVRSDRREPRWSPTAASRVCSLHFGRAQYLSKRVLHSRAVPAAKYEVPEFMRGYKRPPKEQEPAETIDLADDIPDDPYEFPDIDEPPADDVAPELESEDQSMEVAAPTAPADEPLEHADEPNEPADEPNEPADAQGEPSDDTIVIEDEPAPFADDQAHEQPTPAPLKP